MRWLTLFSLFLCLFVTSCSHKQRVIPRDIASLKKTDAVEGIWFLQGTSSLRGPYNGELELRKSHDGTYHVVRVVTYINYFYEGLKVQEVWTGSAVAADDSIVMSYELKQADFIQKLRDQKRENRQFTNNIRVDISFKSSDSGLSSSFSDRKGSTYSEWITTKRDLEADLLWKNERSLEEIAVTPPTKKAAENIRDLKKKIGFESTELAKASLKRPEYRDGKYFIVRDPTDFEFYRKHTDVIRIVNKVTDDISIAESVVKRNAYAPSLQQKAVGYEKNTLDNHINEAGVIAPAYLSAGGDVRLFEADKDSALRTGVYLASQSMRYSATQDPQALENIRKSIRGINTFLEIADGHESFARSVALFNSANPIPEGWVRGQGRYAHLIWLPGASREHLEGIVHGLVWSSVVAPRNVKGPADQVRAVAASLERFPLVRSSRANTALVNGLVALNSKEDTNRLNDFIQAVQSEELGSVQSLNKPYSLDWRELNLDLMNQASMILISSSLGDEASVEKFRTNLELLWSKLKSYKRPSLDLTAQAFLFSNKLVGGVAKVISPDEMKEIRGRIRWSLRELPYPRPSFDVTVDHSKNPSWALSFYPREIVDLKDLPQRNLLSFYQGAYAYPMFEMQAYASSFVWSENPFEFTSKQASGLEMPGIDYLYGYWLVRLLDGENID